MRACIPAAAGAPAEAEAAIAATYNTDFAEDKIGRPTRDILERHGPKYFGVAVDPRSHSMKRWNTNRGGGMLAVGVD